MTLRAGVISSMAVAALSFPIGVLAQSQDTITVTARDREAQEQEVVCKYQAKTGTRFKHRDCRTRLQWDQLSVQSQRDAKEMIDLPKICGGGGNPEGC